LVHRPERAFGAASDDARQDQHPEMVGRNIRAVGARWRTVTGGWSLSYGGGHVCVRHAAYRPVGDVHGRRPTSVPVLFLPAIRTPNGHHGLRTPIPRDCDNQNGWCNNTWTITDRPPIRSSFKRSCATTTVAATDNNASYIAILMPSRRKR